MGELIFEKATKCKTRQRDSRKWHIQKMNGVEHGK